jgi:hypothetical protein
MAEEEAGGEEKEERRRGEERRRVQRKGEREKECTIRYLSQAMSGAEV